MRKTTSLIRAKSLINAEENPSGEEEVSSNNPLISIKIRITN